MKLQIRKLYSALRKSSLEVRMRKWRILTISGVLISMILVISGYVYAQIAGSGCGFRPHSLVGASLEDVKKAALDYTCATHRRLEGTPEVRLARFVTSQEVTSLLGDHQYCPQDKLALVIIKGKFAFSGPGYVDSSKIPPYEYLAYIFDLQLGIPTSEMNSPNGSEFRAMLNDPSLPTPIPLPKMDNSKLAPFPPAPRQLSPCDYKGTVLPTAVAPGLPTRKPYP